MESRFVRIALVAALVLLAAFVAQPYIALLIGSATQPRAIEPRGELADFEKTSVALFERVSPSVVHVFAQAASRRIDPFGNGSQDERAGGSGTGFVWDAAGHVVTNNHVVQNASAVAVRLNSGEVVPATIVGTAPNYDLAVLRLGRVSRMPPPIAVGTSGDLKVGQSTYAIGNPFGLDQTLTTGVISALQRRLPTGEGRELADVIQTDAAINPGNSGGPLLDSAGRLIGVNTAIFSPSGASAGIGFAIPVDVVNRVVPELIRTGRTPNPGIGIIAAREEAASRLGIEGIVIYRVLRGSPAAQAGLRGVDERTGEIGDIVVAVEGERVRRLSDFTAALSKIGVGNSARLTVDRGGREIDVAVAIADIAR